MAIDDETNALAAGGKAALWAAAAALDPSLGIASALAHHLITSATIDSAWRSANFELLTDVLVEVAVKQEDEREYSREQYQSFDDEFRRYDYIIRWLEDEVSRLHGDVADVKAIVLGMLRDSEAMLRSRPDPEMRPYFVAAWANALSNPKRFPDSWVRRLTTVLVDLSADHIALLKKQKQFWIEDQKRAAIEKERKDPGSGPVTPSLSGPVKFVLMEPRTKAVRGGDNYVVFEELKQKRLVMVHVHPWCSLHAISGTSVRPFEQTGPDLAEVA